VKFTCSSRFSRASQSPYTVEKQPKSTPDMYYPPRPTTGVGSFKHTLMDIHCCCGGCVQNFAKILRSREQRFNKRLSICHRFFTLSVPAVCYTAMPVFITSSYSGDGRSSAIRTGSIKKLIRRVSDHKSREISILRSP